MWAEVLGVYAAVVSTGSLAVSYLSHRSGGPQLSGGAEITGRYDIDGPKIFVEMHNRGRGPITVDFIDLWGIGAADLEKGRPVVGWPLRSPSRVLPSRIEGNSGERWSFPAHAVCREWLGRDDLVRLEVQVSLATGKNMSLKVDTSNIDVLRGRELPDWEPDYFKNWPKRSEQERPDDARPAGQ